MTTPLDPPAAAARRQYLLDRWCELLGRWGCPDEYAGARALALLEVAVDVGYALPTVIAEPVAPRGPGSSHEARIAALQATQAALARARRHRGVPADRGAYARPEPAAAGPEGGPEGEDARGALSSRVTE